MFAFKLITRAQ